MDNLIYIIGGRDYGEDVLHIFDDKQQVELFEEVYSYDLVREVTRSDAWQHIRDNRVNEQLYQFPNFSYVRGLNKDDGIYEQIRKASIAELEYLDSFR